MKHPIICVVGPTASGKTRLAVELAKALDGEVLSCDSMQVYRRMNIGTAKPTAEETQGIPHHMIDVAEPQEAFSVGKYVAMADPILQDILSRGKTAVICGGTGLYVDSLIAGRTFAPFPQTGRRQELEAMDTEKVLELLRTFDPDSADRLHPSDRKRIIRAAEVYLETGKTITQHNLETQAVPPKYSPLWLGLDFTDREELYARINKRVDMMVKDGLMEEIQGLLAEELSPAATSLQAIGYKEPLTALRGEISLEEAFEQIKQESRRYAKRQLTWFRRNKAVHWLFQQEPLNFEETLAEAMNIVKS